MYKSAAMVKVRQAIYARTKDKTEQKRLYTLLRDDKWQTDNFLHRQMRKHFRHGRSTVANQFIVRSDKQTSKVVDGRLSITIRIANKYSINITLTTTSSGKNVDLTGRNLRIIVKGDCAEIHYAAEKGDGRECGSQVIGIDKGYTEAFTDSDGQAHGENFGSVLTEYSDKTAETNKQRNKLHALEKKCRKAGNIAKADRIKQNNLGRKKIDARRDETQGQLRNIAFQSAHSIVEKAAMVVSEDLASPIAKKQQWKKFNRRMSSWAKGVLADALDSVSTQRKAKHVLVNSAYTSQMDSTTGLLQGKRVGDKFYRENGDVLQADHNAALNVLARLGDNEISRFTPYKEVRRILLTRSPAQLSVNRLELGAKARQPSADKS
jgi:archaellin